MRQAHPGWGPRTILTKLRKEFDDVPSRSGIYRTLVRHRLIDPTKRRRKREDYQRWERSRSMELWQMDVVGRIYLTNGIQLSAVTGLDDHSRFCVIAKLVPRATARPVCDALVEGLKRHGIPDSILTDNGKVFTGKHGLKASVVLFDRICHNNGIKHILTAPYSPTTTGKVERFHETLRKEFVNVSSFDTIEEAQAALDTWVVEYNNEREHQAIGDVAPIRRFELATQNTFEVVEGGLGEQSEPQPTKHLITRRVDQTGRISILKFQYHVGRWLTGQTVLIEARDGLMEITHNNVVVATHARKHLPEQDESMHRRPKAAKPKSPTRGEPVKRMVDSSGSISFAGTPYRVGNKYIHQEAEIRLVDDTVQITISGSLIRTHKARHDKSKEFGAFAQPKGHKKRRGTHVA